MNQFLFSFLTLVLGASGILRAQGCGMLSEAKRSSLVDYVRKQYKLDDAADLKLASAQPVGNGCYQALTFEGKSPVKTWRLTLYLSPDQRYLTGDLFDTTLDPVAEQRRKANELMAGLVPNKGSSKGAENAPVTIVEFSDFQCPYCRRLALLMDQLTPTERDQVRIIFHHFPLSMHEWARQAAEGAACAQLQGADAFWAIHDQLFQHQQEITAESIKQKLAEYARNSKSIDLKSFQACMESEMSLGLVFRDMNLASASNIQATPTLFINGHRVPGIKDADELRRLIAEAAKEAGAAASPQDRISR
jgi:protein-disulfide isomerase